MIKWLVFILFINQVFAYDITGKVIKIVDGDTFDVLDANHVTHRIRPDGIDAPERGQPFGKKSTQMLAALIAGKTVTNTCTKKDRYNRDICVVWLDGEDINRKMVERGGAWVYRKYYKDGDYYEAENKARKNHRGLWKTTEAKAIPPWEWRKR